MQISIKNQSDDNDSSFDLDQVLIDLERKKIEVRKYFITKNFSIGFSSHEVLTIFVSVSTGIAINVLSSYLYDLIKEKKLTIRIGSKVLNQNTQEDYSILIEEALRMGSDELNEEE